METISLFIDSSIENVMLQTSPVASWIYKHSWTSFVRHTAALQSNFVIDWLFGATDLVALGGWDRLNLSRVPTQIQNSEFFTTFSTIKTKKNPYRHTSLNYKHLSYFSKKTW